MLEEEPLHAGENLPRVADTTTHTSKTIGLPSKRKFFERLWKKRGKLITEGRSDFWTISLHTKRKWRDT